MSQLDVKSPKQLGTQVDLLTNQLERLGEEVVAMRREHRADLDRLVLELESIKEFMEEAHPELQGRYQELREQVRLEVSPE